MEPRVDRGSAGRRERWAIAAAILAAVDAESHRGPDARLTTIASRANVAYDRLAAYLTELYAQGLVTGTRPPQLTPKGRVFLLEYRQWLEVLERFGFANAETGRRDGGARASTHAESI